MWRFITIFFLLFFLAQSANALSISKYAQNHELQQVHFVQDDEQISANFDDYQPNDLFNLPRINTFSPATFSIEAQTAPNYVLVIEFFKTETSASEFKNLAPPANINNWFEQLNHHANSSRISGWKDGNFLYSAKNTYHS